MTVDELETRIGEWRTAILRGRAVDVADADELEGHLREQISDLEGGGLTSDEAFLIAVGRLGKVDQLTAEFAREHSDRLWKQLASPPADDRRQSVPVMIGFALFAAVLIQVARLIAVATPSENQWFFGDEVGEWFFRNMAFWLLPVLGAYFVVLRRVPWRRVVVLGAILAILALAVNLFPFASGSSTGALVGIYLPLATWFVVGAAYAGGDVRSSARRMDFIRFTGEWAIYFVLIVMGGGVLLALTTLIISPIAPDAVEGVITWVMPSGGAAAVIVAAWLVEAKKSIIENLAPVLTAIFTPLFAIMLLAATVVYLVGGIGLKFDRDLLTVFDVLLLVVVGLVVYGVSARDIARGPGAMDVIRLVAVGAAIILDVLVLVSMLARVGELGFTANRLAALGLNLLLLANLAGTAWFIVRLLAKRAPAVRLERWQTGYLPVFAAWVLFVVLAIPPLFGFA